MKKLFVSHLCPDCPPAIEKLEAKGEAFEILDISLSLSCLREFLALRDRKEFEPIKARGSIGLPLLYDGDKIYFDLEDF